MATVNASYSNRMGPGDGPYQNSPTASNNSHSVGFKVTHPAYNNQQDDRVKYLTAKYPKHQMSLIRKRIAVENWLDDELRKLYGREDDSYDCEIDIDDLLDTEELERPQFIKEKLASLNKSQAIIDKFADDLLEKAQTL